MGGAPADGIFTRGSIDPLWTPITTIALILFTVLLENILHRLETSFRHDEVVIALIHKVYQELMILGFLSFALLLIIELELTSDQGALHIFEFAHMWMFGMGLTIVVHTFVSITVMRNKEKSWSRSDKQGIEKAVSNYQASKTIATARALKFQVMKNMFLTRHELSSQFRFAKYLFRSTTKLVVTHLEHIHPLSWSLTIISVTGYILLVYFTQHWETRDLFPSFIIGWALFVFSVFLNLLVKKAKASLLKYNVPGVPLTTPAEICKHLETVIDRRSSSNKQFYRQASALSTRHHTRSISRHTLVQPVIGSPRSHSNEIPEVLDDLVLHTRVVMLQLVQRALLEKGQDSANDLLAVLIESQRMAARGEICGANVLVKGKVDEVLGAGVFDQQGLNSLHNASGQKVEHAHGTHDTGSSMNEAIYPCCLTTDHVFWMCECLMLLQSMYLAFVMLLVVGDAIRLLGPLLGTIYIVAVASSQLLMLVWSNPSTFQQIVFIKSTLDIDPETLEQVLEETKELDQTRDRLVHALYFDLMERLERTHHTHGTSIRSEVLEQLEVIFDEIDVNHDKTLSRKEVTSLFTRLRLPRRLALLLADDMDEDVNGEVDFDEFKSYLFPLQSDNNRTPGQGVSKDQLVDSATVIHLQAASGTQDKTPEQSPDPRSA